MEEDESKVKETLGDIVRNYKPKEKTRKRKRKGYGIEKMISQTLDERKLEIIEQLFDNAKENMQRSEEEKKAREPVPKEVLPTPKIKIENGKLVIDKEGMVDAINTEKPEILNKEIVHEKGNKLVSAKRIHSDRWKLNETEQFYTALQLFGTDFGMISKFMKKRTREQVKSKYKKESRLNAAKIDYATCNRIPLSLAAYEKFLSYLNRVR